MKILLLKDREVVITTNGRLLGNKKEPLLNAKPQISQELSIDNVRYKQPYLLEFHFKKYFKINTCALCVYTCNPPHMSGQQGMGDGSLLPWCESQRSNSSHVVHQGVPLP